MTYLTSWFQWRVRFIIFISVIGLLVSSHSITYGMLVYWLIVVPAAIVASAAFRWKKCIHVVTVENGVLNMYEYRNTPATSIPINEIDRLHFEGSLEETVYGHRCVFTRGDEETSVFSYDLSFRDVITSLLHFQYVSENTLYTKILSKIKTGVLADSRRKNDCPRR